MNVSPALSQGTGLFEMLEEPEQEWTSKQMAELQRAPIILNLELLQNLKTRSENQFTIMGLTGEIHQVEVTRIMEQLDGDWSILGHIDGDWMNSFTLSFSNGEVLSSLRMVSLHKFLEIRFEAENEKHYLMHIDPHGRDELVCGFDHDTMPERPDEDSFSRKLQSFRDPQTLAIIDVLVVYTPAAQSWASVKEGGINNVINQAMAIAQNSLDNSQINFQFRLVYRTVVDYIETGNSRTDLNNLTNRVIPNVQSLRNQHAADLVVMLTDTEDNGGIAWLNTNPNGSPAIGYSITRVQQASWTTTLVHEIGHNMGSHHSRNQTIQPAPERGGVFNYSTGWRWTGTDNQSYASIMAYTETSIAVDLFSNPDIFHQGAQSGTYNGTFSSADNSRSMREMMHVVAGYRTEGAVVVPPSVSTSSVTNILSNSAQTGGNVSDDGGSEVISRGACLSTKQNPNQSDDCRFSGSGIGNFNVRFSDLSANTIYYIRAFATNSVGTTYGSQQSFTTISGLPLVTTAAVRDVSFKTALVGGTVSNTGSSTVINRGVCWSISQNPGLTENCRSIGSGSGAYSDLIHQLIRDTIYYVRAYATNGQGTAYGNEQVFVTLPVVVDANRSSISVNTLKVQANNRNSSTVTVIARDFEGVRLPGFDTKLISKQGVLKAFPSTVLTNSNGEAKFVVSNSKVEQVTYGAISGVTELSSEASVQFIGIDAKLTSLELSSNIVQANGIAVSRIIITAIDENNAPFSNLWVDLIPDGGSSVIKAIQRTTDGNGIAIFEVSNQIAEHVSYRAVALGTTTVSSVEINYVSLDPDRSTVIVDTERVEANGVDKAVISVKAIDINGGAIQGVLIELADGGAGTNIEPGDQRTDSDGLAKFEIRNSSIEVVDFTATAVLSRGNIPIRKGVSISFIPLSPMVLSATEVSSSGFQANWELVLNSDSYLLDVATDSSFTNLISGYDSLDVGMVTSYRISDANPGSDYVYRVRSAFGDLIGAVSEPIMITTFPETPIGLQASDHNALTFLAKWQVTEGARAYRIDVSTDAEFSEILSDYNNLSVGDVTSIEISGLESGKTYYYRTRAEAGVRTSVSSNIIVATTLIPSPEKSIISQQQSRILANGNQTNEVLIIVKSQSGVPLKGLSAELTQEGIESQITAVQSETDAEGIARFQLSSRNSGKSTYKLVVNEIRIGELAVEFLADIGILSLGNNYPNPFVGTTLLQITIPAEMDVEIQIFDILGKSVQTIINGSLEPGYYEVSFDGHGLSAGIYICRMIAGDKVLTERMVMVN